MIRLVTVIGHGINLLPHFLDHYIYQVDEIYIVVYVTESHPTLVNDVEKIIKNYNKVNIIRIHEDRVFDWERVTMLYNYVTNKEPNDWWVVADIDEFQVYSSSLDSIITNCEEKGNDIVRGGFIDRLGPNGEFSEILPNLDIFKQYPLAGFFRYPMSGANPNKICVMKGYVHLTNGQHYANINEQTTWRWQGWNHPLINNTTTVQVHHFKWDSTSIERLNKVADVNKEYAYSSEYRKMVNELTNCDFKIDLNNPDFMFEENCVTKNYNQYKQWNKLINKIMSI